MLLRRHKENYQPQSSVLKNLEGTAPLAEALGTVEEKQEDPKGEVDTLCGLETPANGEELEVPEESEKSDLVEETEVPKGKRKAGDKHESAGKGKGKA